MIFDELDSETLWLCYQRGYHCLMRSGRFFQIVLRPALSHVYFQRAVPILLEYARANRGMSELPPGFGEQMVACPLTHRDLMHLDYAICLGISEAQSKSLFLAQNFSELEWPGPTNDANVFIPADSQFAGELAFFYNDMDDMDDMDDDGDDDNPPYDL